MCYENEILMLWQTHGNTPKCVIPSQEPTFVRPFCIKYVDVKEDLRISSEFFTEKRN